MQRNETLLQVLSSPAPDSRITLSMIRCEFSGETRLRLRQESHSEAVGWFAQSHIDLTPDQLSQFKAALGPVTSLTRPAAAARRRETEDSLPLNQSSSPILKMPSVMAG